MTEAAKDWVLRKRGYFYRPNSQGYTSSIHQAGRYTEADAKAHATAGCDPPVTAHHESEYLAPNFVEIYDAGKKQSATYRFYGRGVWTVNRDGEWRTVNGIYVPARVLQIAAAQCVPAQ